MIEFILYTSVAVLCLWLLREVRAAERSARHVYAPAGVDPNFSQTELGRANGPMDGVVLDRGIKLELDANGKYIIVPTAKYSSEYQR